MGANSDFADSDRHERLFCLIGSGPDFLEAIVDPQADSAGRTAREGACRTDRKYRTFSRHGSGRRDSCRISCKRLCRGIVFRSAHRVPGTDRFRYFQSQCAGYGGGGVHYRDPFLSFAGLRGTGAETDRTALFRIHGVQCGAAHSFPGKCGKTVCIHSECVGGSVPENDVRKRNGAGTGSDRRGNPDSGRYRRGTGDHLAGEKGDAGKCL